MKKSDPKINQYKYLAKNPWAKYAGYARNRRLRFGREMTMTTQDFKELWFRDKAYLMKRPSIDRIDNSKGYVKENCRFVELTLNCHLGGKATPMTYKRRKSASKLMTDKWIEYRKNNKTTLGVSVRNYKGKICYESHIYKNGKFVYLGRFDTKNKARDKVLSALDAEIQLRKEAVEWSEEELRK